MDTINHFSCSGIIAGSILLIILLLASTLLSASIPAYSSLSAEDIERLKTSSKRNARNALRIYNTPNIFQSTIYTAININNILIVLLSVFLGSLIIDQSSYGLLRFFLEAVIIILLIFFFGKILPGLFTSERNISLALFMATPLSVIEKMLRPLTLFQSPVPPEPGRHASTMRTNLSPDERSNALEQSVDNFNEDEKILEGIVNFGNINVSSIMCPRIDVTVIDIRLEFSQVIQVIINSGFSRIPVYSETFDNVKGILYAKDILPFMSNPGNFKWQSLLREPYFVPETKRISDLLKEFQVNKIHMAVVIDEYGGTSGIVTLEDILEEIVGEITDESDDDKVPYRKIDEKTYVFEGRILLNDIIKILKLNNDPFEDSRGESETLAGLILEITGEIPEQGQIITYKNFIFTIESADRRRIKEIRVEINIDNEKPQEE